MMSKRCEYALRALIDIALARGAGRPLLAIHEIASRERIPEKFLEQILLQLRRAGLLSSRRGRSGGYSLAKPPRSVRIGAVVRLIDGPLAPLSCVSRSAYGPCSCPDEAHCGLHRVMVEARDAIASILDGYTLADVVRESNGAFRRDRLPVPFATEEV